MKKVILLLCMVLLLGVALSSCATANGSSAANAPAAPNAPQSAPSAGTSEASSKQNSQASSGSVSAIKETPNGTYISDETTDRLFEDYALLYYRDALCGHTWDDPSQIDTESLIQFYWVNKARES
ncbi:MAG: hypothetical protein PHG73_08985, partial [Pygmaiobacter sp.]|nr:hypothetical protein [Pygmaiobacter sp.]